jgi:hypothetical protein
VATSQIWCLTELLRLQLLPAIASSGGALASSTWRRPLSAAPCGRQSSVQRKWRLSLSLSSPLTFVKSHRVPAVVPLPLPTPLATPPLAPLAEPVIPPRAIPLPLAPLPAVEADAPPLVLPLAGVLADGTLLYLLGGLDVVGGCSTNDVSVVRKVASMSGGAVCVGMCRSEWCLESGEEKFLARAKDCGVGA